MDFTKLKIFPHDTLNIAEMMVCVYDRIENSKGN